MNRFARKSLAPAIALSMGVALSGCELNINAEGDGVPLAELQMEGAAPDTLSVAAPDQVIVTEGETLDITVEGSEEAAADLRFDLDGGDLAIYRANDWNGSASNTIRVTMPAPRDINVGGSGNVETEAMGPEASINIGGSGNVIVAAFEATRLDVNIGGSGEVSGGGTVDRLEVTIGGSGDVKFGDVQVGDAEVTIGGSGDVAFASDGNVEATIAGSGEINVVGDATCELNSFGSGELNCTPRSEPAETPPAEAEES